MIADHPKHKRSGDIGLEAEKESTFDLKNSLLASSDWAGQGVRPTWGNFQLRQTKLLDETLASAKNHRITFMKNSTSWVGDAKIRKGELVWRNVKPHTKVSLTAATMIRNEKTLKDEKAVSPKALELLSSLANRFKTKDILYFLLSQNFIIYLY